MIEGMLKERRSLEQALADLLAVHQREPGPQLTRIIELLRAEIDLKRRGAVDGSKASTAPRG